MVLLSLAALFCTLLYPHLVYRCERWRVRTRVVNESIIVLLLFVSREPLPGCSHVRARIVTTMAKNYIIVLKTIYKRMIKEPS